jgi:hypothetical protein
MRTYEVGATLAPLISQSWSDVVNRFCKHKQFFSDHIFVKCEVTTWLRYEIFAIPNHFVTVNDEQFKLTSMFMSYPDNVDQNFQLSRFMNFVGRQP